MVATKFEHGEIVHHVITEEKGIITAVIFHSEDYYTYNVSFGTGLDMCKEEELKAEEDFKNEQIL